MTVVPTFDGKTSVDYYFLGALEDLVAAGAPSPGRPIESLGPHAFAHGDRLVIIRYLTRAELQRVESRSWRRVWYLLDDMLPVVEQSTDLPKAYRHRMGWFVENILPRILSLDPVIVTPNEEVRHLFPGCQGEHLDPMCLSLSDDLDHFDGLSEATLPLRVVFLGARTHRAGMRFIVDVARALRPLRPRLELHSYFGWQTPPSLASKSFARCHLPMPWPAFKAWLATARFHVLVAPLPETAFNIGRSTTKILDAAAVGAAGLFASRPPFSGHVEDGESGLLLPDQPAVWADALSELACDRQKARFLAEGTRALAKQIGDPMRVRSYWLERLGLTELLRSSTAGVGFVPQLPPTSY